MPAMMLVQAPVFHAHTFSIYIELDKPMAVGDFARNLAGEHVQIARTPEDSPSNVNVAGKDEIMVAVRRDVVHENGFWLWAAVDNLRLAALTAADCAGLQRGLFPHPGGDVYQIFSPVSSRRANIPPPCFGSASVACA